MPGVPATRRLLAPPTRAPPPTRRTSHIRRQDRAPAAASRSADSATDGAGERNRDDRRSAQEYKPGHNRTWRSACLRHRLLRHTRTQRRTTARAACESGSCRYSGSGFHLEIIRMTRQNLRINSLFSRSCRRFRSHANGVRTRCRALLVRSEIALSSRISAALQDIAGKPRGGLDAEQAEAHQTFKRGHDLAELIVQRDKLVFFDVQPVAGE